MINQNIIKALKVLIQKLENKNIKWTLVGSTGLALQGVKVEPNDIDILSDKDGALQINKLLKDYEVKPVAPDSPCENFKSHFGTFLIEGVEIEVMGDFKIKSKVTEEWICASSLLVDPDIIEIKGVKVPVSPLRESLKMYVQMGRKKDLIKIQKIKDAIEEHLKPGEI